MQVIEGNALSNLVDYSFGDHSFAWNKHLTGSFEPANLSNLKFLSKAKEFEGRVITLFIDNIRLYVRNLPVDSKYPQDAEFVNYLMQTNDLLDLCSKLPKNKFIIFTSHEDTPIDDTIKVPDNVLKIYACNALYNNDKIIPFPIGLQRQIGEKDKRLEIMRVRVNGNYSDSLTGNRCLSCMKEIEDCECMWRVYGRIAELDKENKPSKLLYINCGVERNPERAPLAKFETNSWCTTRFDKDSKFFPYDRYNEFLSELRDHKFVACPKGHGYDTHRIWETLYMRRVPVILDDPYFRKLLEGFPVVFLDKWDNFLNNTIRKISSLQMLNEYEDIYQQAQTMDLNKLDLKQMYGERKNG